MCSKVFLGFDFLCRLSELEHEKDKNEIQYNEDDMKNIERKKTQKIVAPVP